MCGSEEKDERRIRHIVALKRRTSVAYRGPCFDRSARTRPLLYYLLPSPLSPPSSSGSNASRGNGRPQAQRTAAAQGCIASYERG